MKGKPIYYTGGYKYQLKREAEFNLREFTPSLPTLDKSVGTDYIFLDKDWHIVIRKGYAWDGASGPTIDTKSSMRGSLVHDALYQLMRLGLLSEDLRESAADQLLHDICEDDHMIPIRADVWELMVNLCAESCAKAGSEKEVQEAP